MTLICKTCSSDVKQASHLYENGNCEICERTRLAKKELQDQLDNYDRFAEDSMPKQLNRGGMSNREMRAEWRCVPSEIKKVLPKPVMEVLATGNYPKNGFGIGSNTGSGKTMCLSCIVKGFHKSRFKMVYEYWIEKATGNISYWFEFKFKWISWPDTVNYLRANALNGEAESFLSDAERTPLLILDDLGRERIKGSYVDDWAASQLDRIINYRYREELPILWTTNLTEEQLVSIYGMALVSRLTEDNPLYWIEGLPSMRIK